MLLCCRCPLLCMCFFFSSRRRHTRLVSDWSSDVCSSDLNACLRNVVLISASLQKGIKSYRVECFISRKATMILSFLSLVIQIGGASCRERVWRWVGGG